MESNLEQAIAAVRAGDASRAFRLLSKIIETNPQSKEAELAWIWMTAVTNDPERKRQCLEAALLINPDNRTAQTGLRKLGEIPRLSEDVVEEAVPTPSSGAAAAIDSDSNARLAVERYGSDATSSHVVPLPAVTWEQLLGLAGAFLLVLGVFLPILRVPIVGSTNYFQNGQGDGVIIILLALVVVGFVVLRRFNWLWLPGLLSLTLIGFTLSSLVLLLSEVRQSITGEIEDGLFGGLANMLVESFQIEWGWVVLITGSLLILGAAYMGRQDNWRKHVVTSLMIAVGVFLILSMLRLTGVTDLFAISSSNGDGPSTTRRRMVNVSVGEPIVYEAGTLRVLQVHLPTAFYITSSTSLGREAAEPVRGTVFAAVELEFRCAESTAVVCDTVPEASLELLLADGRQVDDDWNVYDAPELGDEDVGGGKATTGWRVFRVPEDAELEALVIDPYSGGKIFQAALPIPRDGFIASHPSRELDSGGSYQLIPGLRRALTSAGIQAPIVARFENNGEGFVAIEMCEKTTFYFDEDEALADHRRSLLDMAEEAVGYLRGGEDFMITISDCDLASFSQVRFFVSYTDLDRWRRRQYSDTELLDRVYVSLD